MATDIAGLFGLTPESYQMAQDQAAQEQAAKYASMNPFERASYGMFRSGQQIGGAIGQALGAQDPMLQQISQQQSLLKSIDFSNPDSIKQAISQASAINPQLAASLLGKYQESLLSTAKIGAEQALAEQRKREKQAADPIQQLIRTGKYTSASVAKYQETGNIADLENTEKADPTTLAETAEGIFLINKATGEPIKKIGSAPQRGVVVSPEIKMTNQELDWRKQFLTENKVVSEQGANVRQALNLLQQSQTSPFADAAFANTVVSAFGGDKQKSKSEIDRLVKAGSLDERIANTLTGFFEGTTSAKTKADQERVLQAVDKALEARYNSSASGWKPRLEKAKVDSTLVIPDYSTVVGASPTASIPVGKTVKNKAGEKFKVEADGTLTPLGR
jgi:hypothetical protein